MLHGVVNVYGMKYIWTPLSRVVKFAFIIEASKMMITLFQILFYHTQGYKVLL